MLRILIGPVIALAAFAAHAQQIDPGEWEFANTMTSPMFPQAQTMTIRRCITAKEAADPAGWQPRPETDCKVTPKGKSADSVSWELSCPKSGMTGTGTARLAKGAIESEMKMRGQGIEMTTKTKGRLLGPCK